MVYFQTKNPTLGKFLKGLRMEKIGIFFGNLKNITTICNILWPFGNLCSGSLVSFPLIWYMYCVTKNLATLGDCKSGNFFEFVE
jgi:hypothetical protein